LDGVVRTDGSVGDVVVVHSLDSGSEMDAEAVRAFRKWRFTPGTIGGRPTAVIVGVEMTFKIAQ
jgi:TonB family protein